MAQEPNADDDADQEPDEDTPDTDAEEQQDTPEPEQPDEWEARYKELEKAHGRQAAELGIWRSGKQPRGTRREAEPEADAQPADDEATSDAYLSNLEEQSWELARERYGAPSIEAYTAAYEILDRAQTPADYIAAFEAYHDIRSKGGTTADAAAAATGAERKTRTEAVQPRVDTNRSDAGPDLTDKTVEEARKSGNLKDFVSAATARMGFNERPKG